MDPFLRTRLVRKYGSEQVFVAPYEAVRNIPDKLSLNVPDWKSLLGKGSRFMLRSDAEYNPAVVQIIPYILVTDKTHKRYYVTKRIAGEERLKGTLALGCGGHINPTDINSPKNEGLGLILNGAFRELNEELDVKLIQPELLETGTVRDLTSDTSEHLGIVYLAEASTVKVKEKEKMSGGWMDFNALVNNYEKFESWARHIIDFMYEN